ncbi:MAG TPA: ABC transporter substrate-binding protein [Negativicutes bacterium]|nr:ABC transporter substrate-binding protein [Negativicutes bacterium]
MKRKLVSLLLVCIMIASLGLTGCGKTTAETAAPADTIKVGWYGSLTGDQAVWGTCEFNGAKMVIDEINEKGGVLGKKLELIGYDTKGDSQEAVNVVRRLTGQDKVVAVLGTNSSGPAIAVTPVLEQAKVPGICTVATNPKVTVIDGKVNPYQFRVCFIDPYQGGVAAGFAIDVLKAKTAAILYDVGDDYSQGLTQFFEEAFVKKGGQIVAKEASKSGDVDFRPQLSKIKDANPDVIFMPYVYKEAALASNQARELGIKSTFLGGDGWPSDQLISMAKDAVEGSYVVNHLDFNDPVVQDYKNDYIKKYDKTPEINAFLVHDAVLMLVDAINRAGAADSVKIAQALETTSIEGLTGKIKIGKDTHNPEGKEAAIIKIVNGGYVFQQRYSLQ